LQKKRRRPEARSTLPDGTGTRRARGIHGKIGQKLRTLSKTGTTAAGGVGGLAEEGRYHAQLGKNAERAGGGRRYDGVEKRRREMELGAENRGGEAGD